MLSNNEIDTLKGDIGMLTTLTTLRIPSNQLKHIPDAVASLTALDYLDAGNNYIETMTENIGNLVNLKFLYLNKNRLKKIPASIGKCQKLQELDVVRCGAMVLPPELADIPRLENVYMDERTIAFYQNPAYRFRQYIIVVQPGDLLYRSTQNQ